MSNADKMLEELGYEQEPTQLEVLRYYKDDYNVLIFCCEHKEVWKSGEYDGMCDVISMAELKAINEKCKELKWI